MKSLAFTSTVITLVFILNCPTAAIAEPSIKDLEGAWVPADFLVRLRETLSPWTCVGGEILIDEADDRTFKLEYTNFHERSLYGVLALDSRKKADEYELRLRPYPGASEGRYDSYDVPVKLRVGAGGRVTTITVLGRGQPLRIPALRYVRIPVPWRQYVNRLIFAGTWKSESGRVFSFSDAGRGVGFDGQSFSYTVRLPIIFSYGDSVDIRPSTALEPTGNGTYNFKREEDRLLFFRRRDMRYSPPLVEDDPILILKKVTND